MPSSVTIAILNWNSRDMLSRCMDSVKQQTYPAVELLFLDNASSDGSVEFVQKRYPDVPVKAFPENLGFAKAHNWAIRRSNSPYYMPLNPDVVLMPEYVAQMVEAIERDNRIGSVSGKLFFMTEEGQKTDLLYTTGTLMTKSRSPTNRGYRERDRGKYERIEPVFCANGAAPLYRRAMLEDVSLDGDYFCEDFFIYGEDRDLGWRSQLRGWQCLYMPLAVGYHVGFGSGGIHSFHVQLQFTRNRYLTLIRNDRLIDLLVDLPYILMYELIWQLSRVIISPKRLPAHWLAFLEVLRNLPYTLQARRNIQGRRRVPPEYIRSLVVSRLW